MTILEKSVGDVDELLLDDKIDHLRIELVEISRIYGINSDEALKISQELDVVILEKMKKYKKIKTT